MPPQVATFGDLAQVRHHLVDVREPREYAAGRGVCGRRTRRDRERSELTDAAVSRAAPRLDAYRTLNFWQRSNVFTPSNVARTPALVVCNGYSPAGLPLGMQLIGRPLDDPVGAAAALNSFSSRFPPHWGQTGCSSRRTSSSESKWW